mgnify:CR=1 FL=1
MKFEYVGIFMPKRKGRDYEKENNINHATNNHSISSTLVAR